MILTLFFNAFFKILLYIMTMSENINGFTTTSLPKTLEIDSLVTVHYFEYPKTFLFKGESHAFWEFLYVDKGEVTISANNVEHTLKQGQIVFHQPNEFHTVMCNGQISPNLVVISFVCKDQCMSFFNSKIMNIDNRCKNMLATIIREAKKTFSTDISDPYYKALELAEDAPFASLDLIKSSLETFLIYLIRQGNSKNIDISSSIHMRENKKRVDLIIAYLEENTKNNLTLDQICTNCLIGKSLVQKIFKEQTGWSVMEYYYRLKIIEAKLLIKNGNMNFTEIAETLGYSTIHYFSRQFKKIVGMSPSEYSKSIDSYEN